MGNINPNKPGFKFRGSLPKFVMKNLISLVLALIILPVLEACGANPPTPTPPTSPKNLVATFVGGNQVNLTWTASIDDVGVAGYRIFRNNASWTMIGTSPTTSYSDLSAPQNAIFGYYVEAFDAEGNSSFRSNVAWVFVPHATPTPAPSSPIFTATCPNIPAMHDYGLPAPRQDKYSVYFDLSGPYMQSKIKDAMETPKIDANNDGQLDKENGVDVNGVKLYEKTIDGEVFNLIDVRLKAWIRGSKMNTIPLGPLYTLSLKIVPHIQSDDVLLTFEFYKFLEAGRYPDEVVDCKKFVQDNLSDFLTAKVLQGIYDGLATQRPVTIPGKPFEDMVSGLVCDPNATDCAAKLQGINIGSKESLRIGFLMDQGSPKPFSSEEFAKGSDTDWGITLDTDLIKSAIEKKVIAEVAKKEPTATVRTPVNIAFNEGGLDINFEADLGYCFGARFYSSLQVTPQVIKNAEGQSVLVATSSAQNTDVCCSWAQKGCLLVDAIFWDSITGIIKSITAPFGWTEVTINGRCSLMGSADFGDESGTERFYGTAVDTWGTFKIFGRNTYMDTLKNRSPATFVSDC